MQRSPSGDTGTFAARLFSEHGAAVRQYLRRAIRAGDTADDLSQEVFLRVVRGAGRYEPRERERAWVFRIAHNVLLDHRRRQGRSREDHVDVEAAAPATQVVKTDLDRALAGLPEDEREAFLLGEIGGLTYAEIAATTRTTVPAVRSRIYRARLALRAKLIAPAPLASGAHVMGEDDDR